MPKVWVINIENTIGPEAAEPILAFYLPRYLPLLHPGDFFITPVPLDERYVAYITRLRKLPPPEQWLLSPAKLPRPYSLCRAIYEDEKLLGRLRAENAKTPLTLEPFMQTAEALELANKAGLGWLGCTPAAIAAGYPSDINNKAKFKQVAKTLGIRHIACRVETTLDGISKAAEELSEGGTRRILVKKFHSAGGHGNFAGTPAEVLPRVAQWHKGEAVLVEPYERLDLVCGTLTRVTETGCEFIGTDRQFIQGEAWHGCLYPYAEHPELKELSLAFARHYYANGARGYVNLDWGFGPDGEAVAIECNFRHNGFAHILKIAETVFGLTRDRAHIKFLFTEAVGPRTDIFAATDAFNEEFEGRAFALPTGLPRKGTLPLFLAAASAPALAMADVRAQELFTA